MFVTSLVYKMTFRGKMQQKVNKIVLREMEKELGKKATNQTITQRSKKHKQQIKHTK